VRISILQEGEFLPGEGPADRYEQMIEEVALADQLGFHAWGTSEQHFSPPRFAVAAPEVLYAAIARHTSRIKLRVMCEVMLSWNHPILVAERLATLDIVSKGRAELATARSNNMTTLNAFGVKPQDTRAQWEDGMDVLVKAFRDDFVEHDGPVWKIGRCQIIPRCLQKPHPPISVAATSLETHTNAGQLGIGVLTFESYFGFNYLQQCIDAYRVGLAKGHSMFPRRTELTGIYIATAYCAPTRQDAIDTAGGAAMGYFKFNRFLYSELAKKKGYEYLDPNVKGVLDRGEDPFDFLLHDTPSIMLGTPDFFIERLKLLEKMGIEEVLLRVEGVRHKDIMRSLELIGREVIPEFQKQPKLAVANVG
jgi:alkanesulfonate monooxygenase SsuD/methylene tetrahydromethanopterin reductase-like flavin-dependent oxidoreductase (luciferase family)